MSNAPASIGGTFVADASLTTVSPPNNQHNVAAIGWTEAGALPSTHSESVGIAFDVTNNFPQASVVSFSKFDNSVFTSWVCQDFFAACGITVNRSAGTVTFNNSVLTDFGSGAPSVTLNGTLTFTPF